MPERSLPERPGQAFCDSVPSSLPFKTRSTAPTAGCDSSKTSGTTVCSRRRKEMALIGWEQQSVVDNRTQFYDCGCRNSCCNVSREHGNISCIGGTVCCSVIATISRKKAQGTASSAGTGLRMKCRLSLRLRFWQSALAFYVWWKHAGDSSTFKLSAAETASRAKQLALRFMETYDQHLKTKLKLSVGFFKCHHSCTRLTKFRTRTRSSISWARLSSWLWMSPKLLLVPTSTSLARATRLKAKFTPSVVQSF